MFLFFLEMSYAIQNLRPMMTVYTYDSNGKTVKKQTPVDYRQEQFVTLREHLLFANHSLSKIVKLFESGVQQSMGKFPFYEQCWVPQLVFKI